MVPKDNSIHNALVGKYAASASISKLISIGLLVALIFTTLSFGTVEAWSVAVFNLLIFVLTLLWLVGCLIGRELRLIVPATAWPLLALIAFGFLQSIGKTDEAGRLSAISMDVEATRLTIEVAIVLLATMLLFANHYAGVEALSRLASFLVIFGLALAVFGLIQKFSWNGKYYWFIEPSTPPASPFGSFVNRNHFAGYLEMIVPIPLALILVRAVRGEFALLYGFAAMMMGVAVLMTLSRGGMVSLVTGLIFVVAFGLKPALERVKGYGQTKWFSAVLPRIGAVVLILLTISLGVLWVGADAVIDRATSVEMTGEARASSAGKQTVFQSRGWIWRDTAAMIRANWLTGVGLGAYETAYPIYSRSDGRLIVSQAHNDYLQLVADCGVVGGAIGLWFVVVLIRDVVVALRHRDEKMIGIALGCAGGIVAMLVHSLFDFNLQLPSNALLFLALVAVLSNLSAAAAREKFDRTLLSQAARFDAVSV